MCFVVFERVRVYITHHLKLNNCVFCDLICSNMTESSTIDFNEEEICSFLDPEYDNPTVSNESPKVSNDDNTLNDKKNDQDKDYIEKTIRKNQINRWKKCVIKAFLIALYVIILSWFVSIVYLGYFYKRPQKDATDVERKLTKELAEALIHSY